MRLHWRRIISWHPVQLCRFPTTGREVGELRPQWGRSSGDSSVLRIVAHWATILRATFFLEQLLSQWDRGLLDPFRYCGPVGQNYLSRNFVSTGDKVHLSRLTSTESNCGPVGHNYELRVRWARSPSLRFDLSTSGREVGFEFQDHRHSITYSPVGNKFKRTCFPIIIPQWGIISAAFNFLSNGEEVCAFSF